MDNRNKKSKGLKMTDGSKAIDSERDAFCKQLIELIRIRSAELTRLGFSPDMAHFDCVQTVKMVVDELYDECSVGHARQEWYREYARLTRKDSLDSVLLSK